MARDEDEDELLTIAQAAALLGIAPRNMRQHVLQDHLPARKFGHMWQLRRADVEAFARAPRPTGVHRSATRRPRKAQTKQR